MVRFALAVAVAILLVDQLSKAWLIELLMARSAGLELTPFFNLVMVWNPGVSFGLFGAADLGPWPFVALGGLIVVGLAVWLWRVENRLLGIAIGAVIGGAIGNMVDRVRYGAVADFFDFHLMGYHWPAFNVADSAIVVGVGAIVLDSFLHRGEPDEASG
jgi:signal peptidase II